MAELDGFERAMPADEIEEGVIYPVEIDQEERILVKVDGEICALNGICTHEEAMLADGDLEGNTIWCPLHSSGFEVCTGKVNNPPAVVPLDTYDIQIVDGDVYVAVEPRPKYKEPPKPPRKRR